MNMHEAYDKIKIDAGGFGTYIAGPSKTADIEQSLVIGAHGPVKMFVILISED
jgi:L-lactate dehydrogenase complex protein LldG